MKVSSALAFKLMTDPFVGQLTFIRVYSGIQNQVIQFSIQSKEKERVGRILQMHANNEKNLQRFLGDIAAAVGLGM